MESFVFEFNAVPMADCPQAKDFVSARVHVYVFCESLEEGETKARNHIVDQRWNVDSLVLSLGLDPDEVEAFDKPEAELHRKAIGAGIASKFYLRPKQERRSAPRAEFQLPKPKTDK